MDPDEDWTDEDEALAESNRAYVESLDKEEADEDEALFERVKSYNLGDDE